MHFIFSDPRVSFIFVIYYKGLQKIGIEFIQEVNFE
jgi:hypothetical protein